MIYRYLICDYFLIPSDPLPLCLSILKKCKLLTDKLIDMTLKNAYNICGNGTMKDIVTAAQGINPLVDEVVQSLYPPLDQKLLEAR